MQKASKKVLESATRREQAMELRLAGKTYEQIGAAMGITRQAAHELVMKSLEDTLKTTAEDAEQVRAIEVQRLDAVLAELWPNRGDPQVAGAIFKAMERRSKLLGLDAAVKGELKLDDMTDEERAKRIAELFGVAMARAPAGEE